MTIGKQGNWANLHAPLYTFLYTKQGEVKDFMVTYINYTLHLIFLVLGNCIAKASSSYRLALQSVQSLLVLPLQKSE